MEKKIIFMGTPEFAVPSLQALATEGHRMEAVVTAPDRPSGRGLKMHEPAVKSAARALGLTILQPERLDDPGFIDTLSAIYPDLIIVVAFRKLPEQIWSMPSLGTINLHASLLPQYRGAAPINWAIMQGETVTGLTTFFITKRIDTGDIIDTIETPIGTDETAGQLHDRLKMMGADLVCRTVAKVFEGKARRFTQESMILSHPQLRPAPKLTDAFCRIDWTKNLADIYNQIRGLSPYPTAYTLLSSPDGNLFRLKIFFARVMTAIHQENPGRIVTDGHHFLKISAPGGYLDLTDIQMDSRKRMNISTFLHGFHLDGTWRAL